jgi:voltage-gated potassium channel
MTMDQAPVAERAATERGLEHGNAYAIFIFVLTVLSLGVMVGLLLPLSPATHDTLRVWDTIICVIFLVDFFLNLATSHPRRAYLLGRLGWLDFIGSIPAFGYFRLTPLLRLARIVRLVRLLRMLGGQERRALMRDVIANRGQYALFITVLLVFVVLMSSSVFVLQFESGAPNANIKTGGDALWWSIVTITTVGYGDYFPVTALGKAMAVVVMIAGIGLIGALASLLATLLVSPVSSDIQAVAAPVDEAEARAMHAMDAFEEHPSDPGTSAEMLTELSETRAELARTRSELADIRSLLRSMHPAADQVGEAGASGVRAPER